MTYAPTCFGSHRNHHQGAVLCLAKTTKWFIRAPRYRRGQCYGGVSARYVGVWFAVRPLLWALRALQFYSLRIK